jgi:hypothetical protein
MAMPRADWAASAEAELADLEQIWCSSVAAAGHPLWLPEPFGIALDTRKLLG